MLSFIRKNKRRIAITLVAFSIIGFVCYNAEAVPLLIKSANEVSKVKPKNTSNSKGFAIAKFAITIYLCLAGMGFLVGTDWEEVFKNIK